MEFSKKMDDENNPEVYMRSCVIGTAYVHNNIPKVGKKLSANGKSEEHELKEKNIEVDVKRDAEVRLDIQTCNMSLCMKLQEQYDHSSPSHKPWNSLKTKIFLSLLTLLILWLIVFTISIAWQNHL